MKIIPKQHKGASSVTTYSIKLPDPSLAKDLFQRARKNLLNVKDWQRLAGPDSAAFSVVDILGNETNDFVKEGNYLRITIPGIPGSRNGNGDDWVIVERINQHSNPDYEYVAIRVRPAIPPFYDKKEVAHFFSPEATSTFSIERNQNIVTASVNGRNEKPNTKTQSFLSNIRNFFIAIGAMIGLNKSQWKSLVKGLIDKR
jgi:hypothetical protein